MYGRSMVDLEAMLHNHSSKDEGFNEMSKLNTYMLSFIYPKNYKQMTFHIEDEQQEQPITNDEKSPDENIDDLEIN